MKFLRTLKNPPQLKINKVLYKDQPMPVHVRVEQRIVWNLLLVLEAHGFIPHSMDDGDEVIKTPSKIKAMEELFNRDDAYLFLSHKSYSGTLRTVWIRFVFGNELDIVSDYNATNWHGFENVMEKFEPEQYA
jgi:hypothetical protein